MNRLNSHAIGISAAILSAIGMTVLGLLASMGYALEAHEIMKAHHITYQIGMIGTLLGALEAFIFSYVLGYAFSTIYNKINSNK